MFSKVLDCPVCKHRFNYDHEGSDFPERITCPSCRNSSKYSDYSALTFCQQCRAKLKIPLDIIFDSDLSCPSCGTMLTAVGTFADETAASTMGGSNAGNSTDRRQLYKRMLQDGDIFDKYKIIRLLGKGGMAEVYLAEHLLLKQLCAVKLMRSNMGTDSDMAVKRFLREAKLSHQFDHPNIVKVFDVGSDFQTGYLFIAMEYVDGKTLHELAKEKPFSEDELAKVLVSMANALNSLLEARVVHRDIKPSNIMLTNDGVYKLMDLGIAKSESNSHVAGDMTLTLEQSTIGTPNYASPEQCRSAHNVDYRSDIYSLGATLYHLASGKLPFTGTTAVETILNVMQTEAEPLRNHRPDLSDKMIGIIEQMMRKNPLERPQLPDALLAAVYSSKVQKSNKISRLFKTLPDFLHPKMLWKIAVAAGVVVLITVNLQHLSRQNKQQPHKSKSNSASTTVSQSANGKAETDILKGRHPLLAYPDESGNTSCTWSYTKGRSECKFPRVTFADYPEMVQQSEYPPDGKVPADMVLKYALSDFTVSLVFRTPAADNAGILKLGEEINLLVFRKKITLLIGKNYYASTQLEIPPEHWAAITVSCDTDKRKITVFSGDRLIKAYLLPEKMNPISRISWNTAIANMEKVIAGKITVYDKVLNIKDIAKDNKNNYRPAIVNPSKDIAEAEANAITSFASSSVAKTVKKVLAKTAAAPATSPAENNAKKNILRNDLSKLYSQGSYSFGKVPSVSYRPVSIRLSYYRKKLDELLASAGSDKLYDSKVELCRQQIQTLEQQNEIRKKIDEAKKRQYDNAKTTRFKRAFEDYVESSRGGSFQFLCDMLKDPAVDPNVMVNIPKYCDEPLSLWTVALRRFKYSRSKQLVDVLKERYADPDSAKGVSLPVEILALGKNNIEAPYKVKFKPHVIVSRLDKERYIFSILNQSAKSDGKTVGYDYFADNFKKYIMLAPMLEAKDIVDGYGRNPMHYAVMHDDPEIAKLLLAADFADGRKPDNAGVTPWQMALHFGSRKMVEFMQKYDLVTDEKPVDKLQYKLRTSYADKDYETAKQCLIDGADPYAPNRRHLSLLEEACAEKDTEFVRFLLDNGMNPDYRRSIFITTAYTPAWYVALKVNSPEVFDLVLEKLMQFVPRKTLQLSVLREFSIQIVNDKIKDIDAMTAALKKHYSGKVDLKEVKFRDLYNGGNFKFTDWEQKYPDFRRNWTVYLELLFELGLKADFSSGNELRPGCFFEFVQKTYDSYLKKNPDASAGSKPLAENKPVTETPAADDSAVTAVAALNGEKFLLQEMFPELEESRTIERRLAWVKKRLEKIRSMPQLYFQQDMIVFTNQQIAELTKQQQIAREVKQKHSSTSQTNSDTRRFIDKARNYLNANSSDQWKIRNELEKSINDKNNHINVNAVFQDPKTGKNITVGAFIFDKLSLSNNGKNRILQEKFADVNKISSLSTVNSLSDLVFFGKEDIDSGTIAPIFNYMVSGRKIYEIKTGDTYNIANAVKLLVSAPKVNGVSDNKNRSLMHYAVLADDPEFAKKLICAGFTDFNAVDQDKLTPWRMALRRGSWKMVEFFRQYGLNGGETAADNLQFKLWEAARTGNLAEVENLLQAGADPYAENGKSLNLLGSACDTQNEPLVRLLLKLKIDPDRINQEYMMSRGIYRPRDIAAARFNTNILKLLPESSEVKKHPMAMYYLGYSLLYTWRRCAYQAVRNPEKYIPEEKVVEVLKVLLKDSKINKKTLVRNWMRIVSVAIIRGSENEHGVKLVEYLLSLDPDYIPSDFDMRHIRSEKIREMLEARRGKTGNNRKSPTRNRSRTRTR